MEITSVAEELAAKGDGSFTLAEIWDELRRRSSDATYHHVRRLVTRRMTGREGPPAAAVFVEVGDGGYRLRAAATPGPIDGPGACVWMAR